MVHRTILLATAALSLALVGPAAAEEPDPEGDPGTEEAPGPTEASGDEEASAKPSVWSPDGPARPPPWFFANPTLALGWGPVITVVYANPQVRVALHRADSLVFKRTFFGAGAWIRVSPSLVEVGPRIDFAPLDLFDISVTARYVAHWTSVSGRLPYETREGKDFLTRWPREDAIPTHAFELVIEPTLKLKGGPIIVLYRPTFQWSKIWGAEEATVDEIYDAGTDLIIPKGGAWIFQQQGIVLVEALDGEKTAATLRLGALVRHRQVIGDGGDRQVVVGFLGTLKPGRKQVIPTIFLQVLAYVLDTDRVLGTPQVIVGASWGFNKALAPDLR